MSSIKLLAVGDICLQTKSNRDPFEGVKDLLKDKDILFGNLETVLSKKGHEKEKAVPLHVSPDKVTCLKRAGFDLLNVANNHILDRGQEGFDETLAVLDHNGLNCIGAGNRRLDKYYSIIERKNIRVGFLGYNEFCTKPEDGIFICSIVEDKIIQDISKIKSLCDVVVISLHWGIENAFYPSPQQIELARKLVDTGATLILGHHPSVLQGIERYKKGLILYSLGNFQFIDDAHPSIVEKTKESMLLSVQMDKTGITDYKLIPVKINDDYIPCPMDDQVSSKMLSFIKDISRPLAEGKVNEKWWFEQIAREHLVGNMTSWILRIKKYGALHFLQCVKWLVSPFVIKCYLGLLRNAVRNFR